MKKIILLSILLVSQISGTFALSPEDVDKRVDILKGRIEKDYVTKDELHNEFKDSVNTSSQIISNTISSGNQEISNHLWWFSTILSILGLLITILGGFFYYFINKRYREVLSLQEYLENLKIDLTEFIQGKQNTLSEEFINALMKKIIKRLEYEPDNICNVYDIFNYFGHLKFMRRLL